MTLKEQRELWASPASRGPLAGTRPVPAVMPGSRAKRAARPTPHAPPGPCPAIPSASPLCLLATGRPLGRPVPPTR